MIVFYTGIDFNGLLRYLNLCFDQLLTSGACIMRGNMKIKITAVAFCILIFELMSQEKGIRRSVSDDRTGQVFNNFRTDSTEAVFSQILAPNEFLYDSPKNNAEAVYTLDKDVFVEVADDTGGSFIKIRVLDKFHGIIEGWVRSKALKRDRYFGRPFGTSAKLSKNLALDLKINPHWVKTGQATVFSDSSLASPSALLKTGDVVYVDKFYKDSIRAVYFNISGTDLSHGFIHVSDISELALLSGASSDTGSLFKKYDPILLRNDIDRAGFVSYKGITFKNTAATEFTEDKLCRERSADTLFYRSTLSSDPTDIRKRTEVRNSNERPFIAMYRFLPDETIFTSMDSVKCKVLEIVSVPRSAKIVLNGIEESSVSNSITKLYISSLEKFGMDIVFQRETNEYTFSYKKDLSGTVFDTQTDSEKTLKRLIAFRKH